MWSCYKFTFLMAGYWPRVKQHTHSHFCKYNKNLWKYLATTIGRKLRYRHTHKIDTAICTTRNQWQGIIELERMLGNVVGRLDGQSGAKKKWTQQRRPIKKCMIEPICVVVFILFLLAKFVYGKLNNDFEDNSGNWSFGKEGGTNIWNWVIKIWNFQLFGNNRSGGFCSK